MNPDGVAGLPLSPETGMWFRCVAPEFQLAALSTRHTTKLRTRFSPGTAADVPYQTLYLAENSLVCAYEFGALYGSPMSPFSNPRLAFTLLCVRVRLKRVVDLTELGAQAIVGTDAQTLTGDWSGYHQRSRDTSVPQPVGSAPTQRLGQALMRDPRMIEGVISISSKVPTQKILVIFPENLSADSDASYSIAHPDREEMISRTIKF